MKNAFRHCGGGKSQLTLEKHCLRVNKLNEPPILKIAQGRKNSSRNKGLALLLPRNSCPACLFTAGRCSCLPFLLKPLKEAILHLWLGCPLVLCPPLSYKCLLKTVLLNTIINALRCPTPALTWSRFPAVFELLAGSLTNKLFSPPGLRMCETKLAISLSPTHHLDRNSAPASVSAL